MTSSDVEKRLEAGIYGKPQLKIDEQKKYLGNFRERVLITMNSQEIVNDYYFQALSKKVSQGFEEETVLFLNASIDCQTLSKYNLLAKKYQLPCVIKQVADPLSAETIVLVLAAKDRAVNAQTVDIAQICPQQKETNEENKEKKKGFLSILFK